MASEIQWEQYTPRIIRNMIQDFGNPPSYDDDRLRELFVVAAHAVQQELDFSQHYDINLDQITITPDPCVIGNEDQSFVNLTCLKSVCILDLSEARTATSQAIAIRDGSSSIDLKGNALAKLRFIEIGWCKTYQMARDEYQLNSKVIAGAAIMTPFKVFSLGDYGGLYPGVGHASSNYRY